MNDIIDFFINLLGDQLCFQTFSQIIGKLFEELRDGYTELLLSFELIGRYLGSAGETDLLLAQRGVNEIARGASPLLLQISI